MVSNHFFTNLIGVPLVKMCWQLVSNAFTTGTIPLNLVDTLIVHIPKIDSPVLLKDFRPISLCNVLFEIITKVLVNRTRLHLDSFIGSLQSSFVPNRGPKNNALIAKEIVHHMHRKKGKSNCLLLKIDFEKFM